MKCLNGASGGRFTLPINPVNTSPEATLIQGAAVPFDTDLADSTATISSDELKNGLFLDTAVAKVYVTCIIREQPSHFNNFICSNVSEAVRGL